MSRHSDDAAMQQDAFKYQSTKDIAHIRGAILASRRLLKKVHKKQCNNMHCNCGLKALPKLPKFPRG